ncbi:hypothetical protein KC19_5G166400 [Ceratodon purpureus]|uniref:Uncharacterized protein n=1 Tax=Ceratodon purpureus TaxID=3225 RepID=A0A8T0I2B5_CERPU|nr:hypothetical protein KC19_5G166400 [Ceratodon purpureus]
MSTARLATWEHDSNVSVGDLEAQLDDQELEALVERAGEAPSNSEDPKVKAFQGRDQKRRGLLNDLSKTPEERAQEVARTVFPQPYYELKNLLWIEKNELHKKALEDWERKGKLLTAKVERKKKRSGNLRNEVYQLIGFFSVFQGVVLTAVSQSNLLHCNNLWCPIVLSGLASIVTLAGVRQKLDTISALDKTILAEEASLRVIVARETYLRRLGKKFRFIEHCEDGLVNLELESKSKEENWFTYLAKIIYPDKYTFLVQLTLVLFMVAFALSHWRILCHSDPAPYSGKTK